MNEEQIDEIGVDVSLAYKFYQGYGYFLSATVAQWLGIESLPDWQHKTILDLCAIDLLRQYDRKGNKQAQRYMMYFTLHGSYTGRQTILSSDIPADIEIMASAIKLQRIIAPAFIPKFEGDCTDN
jgi:hypothetical protein